MDGLLFFVCVQQVIRTLAATVMHATGEQSNNMLQVLEERRHVWDDNNIWVSVDRGELEMRDKNIFFFKKTISVSDLCTLI